MLHKEKVWRTAKTKYCRPGSKTAARLAPRHRLKDSLTPLSTGNPLFLPKLLQFLQGLQDQSTDFARQGERGRKVTRNGGLKLVHVSNRQRATQESHPDHGRVFTPEATIKSKHFRREELILMEKHMFLATVADGQTPASWVDG